MQINPKQAAASSPATSDSLNVQSVPCAGHDRIDEGGGVRAFGNALDEAMQSPGGSRQTQATTEGQAGTAHAAATPTSAAGTSKDKPDADDTRSEEENRADASQLPDSLQSFVNSLQAPVSAIAKPATSVTSAAEDQKAVTSDAGTEILASVAGQRSGTGRADGSDRKLAGLAQTGGATARRAEPGSASLPAGSSDAAGALAASRTRGAVQLPATSAQPSAPNVATAFKAELQAALLAEASATATGLQTASAAVMGTMAAGSPATGLTQASAVQSLHVAAPLHTQPWQDAFGQQVVWVARHEQQLASLTLNPPELGPVRVTLSIADGQASASFVSLQPEVRQAIQDAVPRLKELFADAGLSLQQTSVGSGDAGTDPRHTSGRVPEDERSQRASAQRTGTDDGGIGSMDDASLRVAHSIASSRLIDLFA